MVSLLPQPELVAAVQLIVEYAVALEDARARAAFMVVPVVATLTDITVTCHGSTSAAQGWPSGVAI
jgi:hypothetical protein